MITPSFALTATERVLPKLALDFTTAILDPRVTVTRVGNTATRINSSGVIESINANLPRFDYDPVTLLCKGLLIEESRKNILLNSLVDGTFLSTQSVSSSAVAYTLSFYGTGSVDLSGTHTATVVGSGAYPTRKTYTFTPTAGTLTLTIAGTVQYAQLEAGSFATSFIPTDSTAGGITRNIDVATMTGTDFSSWYSQSEGALWCEFIRPNTTNSQQGRVFSLSNGSNAQLVELYQTGVSDPAAQILNTTLQASWTTTGQGYQGNTEIQMCLGYKLNNTNAAFNGNLQTLDTTCTMATPDRANIGNRWDNARTLNGWVRKIQAWPFRLTNAEVQAFSK